MKPSHGLRVLITPRFSWWRTVTPEFNVPQAVIEVTRTERLGGTHEERHGETRHTERHRVRHMERPRRTMWPGKIKRKEVLVSSFIRSLILHLHSLYC